MRWFWIAFYQHQLPASGQSPDITVRDIDRAIDADIKVHIVQIDVMSTGETLVGQLIRGRTNELSDTVRWMWWISVTHVGTEMCITVFMYTYVTGGLLCSLSDDTLSTRVCLGEHSNHFYIYEGYNNNWILPDIQFHYFLSSGFKTLFGDLRFSFSVSASLLA